MSVQAVTGKISSRRVAVGVRRSVSKKLNQLPQELHTESKPKIKGEGSCAGMCSWSLNTKPAQKENIKTEGSCAGMVSWSVNRVPTQASEERIELRPFCGGNASSGAYVPAQKGVKLEGSCAGMVSWSFNQSAIDRLKLN